jgi:hypothetical protein
MRRIFLAALGALLLTVVFAENASAQRWGWRGAGWGARGIGMRAGGFHGRPFLRGGWGIRRAGFYGWRRPWGGYGWARPWRRGWGWGAAGVVAGVTAASYYGYPGYGYPAAYGYGGYGYPAYAYRPYGYSSCGCGYRSWSGWGY